MSCRSIKKLKVEQYKSMLQDVAWEEAYKAENNEPITADSDLVWHRWSELFTTVVDAVAPLREKKVSYEQPAWLTHELIRAIKLRNKMAKNATDKCSLLRFTTQRNYVNKLKKKLKRDYILGGIEIGSEELHKRLQRISGLGKSKGSHISSVVNSDNILVESPSAIAECLNERFLNNQIYDANTLNLPFKSLSSHIKYKSNEIHICLCERRNDTKMYPKAERQTSSGS
jgi:hypothetical protein